MANRFFTTLALLAISVLPAKSQQPDALAGAARWDFPSGIISEQHNELLRYFEARIGEAARQRARFWPQTNWKQTVEQNRTELRRIIGAVDSFMPPAPVSKPLAATPAFTFSLVEWPVLRLGNTSSTTGSAIAIVKLYGILLESKRPGKHPAVVAIPDTHLSAADIAGLTQRLPQREQYARILAVNGYVVFVPFFTQRRTFSLPWTEDRDWLVRLGYQVGDERNRCWPICDWFLTPLIEVRNVHHLAIRNQCCEGSAGSGSAEGRTLRGSLAVIAARYFATRALISKSAASGTSCKRSVVRIQT